MENKIYSNPIDSSFKKAIASVAKKDTIEKSALISKIKSILISSKGKKVKQNQVKDLVDAKIEEIDTYYKNLLKKDTPLAFTQTIEGKTTIKVQFASFYLKDFKNIYMVSQESKRILSKLDLCKAGSLPVQEVMDIEARDQNGETPLHVVARIGHIEYVRLLLQSGANINARDSFDQTPMHVAALKYHHEVIELLDKKSEEIESQETERKLKALSQLAK